ncbi:MAG: heme ABC transporter ATP-binding protein CcmA [Nitrosomonadales bacterium]|nr:MAG: heme ABC transporter ATP-binding protein CcmA [Nitrosomonadales bacterium]
MLEGKDLACVRGERTLFSHLNFILREGELLLVQGANGSGKTSLLRMVCGLLAPEFGDILWRGEKIGAVREGYHAEMAYFGHAPAVKEDLTAFENLDFACRLAGNPQGRDEVEGALGHLGLGHCLNLPAKSLSQGQRRRVALARMLLVKARLWILDEPLTALDQAALQLVQSLIGEHLQQGGMALLTTHQPVAIAGVEPRILKLTP